MKLFFVFLILICLPAGISAASAGAITSQPFGKTENNLPVKIYTLRNDRGMEVKITNYGGIVVSLIVPDRSGKMDDVVLGYDNLKDYIKRSPYFGALIGRYGNRIAMGRFDLDGRHYKLAINNGPNALHGGLKGFDKVVWKATPFFTKNGPSLRLNYVSENGEEGYPGTLVVRAVYTLTYQNELHLTFTATTNKPTIVNLTSHSYFNLAGAGSGDILGHVVTIKANRFTPVDKTQIPTGELRPVKGTPFDFTRPATIGSRIKNNDRQLKFGKGYDHNWVVRDKPGKLALVAKAYEPLKGRVLEVFSTEPGLQFYSGNFLDGTNVGKGGNVYRFRYGFCMEPQHFPNSPNQPAFPPVVLRPGNVYRNTISYHFLTK